MRFGFVAGLLYLAVVAFLCTGVFLLPDAKNPGRCLVCAVICFLAFVLWVALLEGARAEDKNDDLPAAPGRVG